MRNGSAPRKANPSKTPPIFLGPTVNFFSQTAVLISRPRRAPCQPIAAFVCRPNHTAGCSSPLHSRRSSIQNPPPSRSCLQRFRTAPQARIDRADQFFWNNAGRLGQSQLPAAARITPPDITETAQVKHRFRQPDSRANQSPLPAGRAAMESPASPFKSSCPQSF